MKSKLLQLTVCVVIGILALTAFSPVARGGVSKELEDSVEDSDGNLHSVYIENKNIYYKFESADGRDESKVLIKQCKSKVCKARVSIDDSLIYISWLSCHRGELEINYCGGELDSIRDWTSTRTVDAEFNNILDYDLRVKKGRMKVIHDGEKLMGWPGDIDGDFIPDIVDKAPAGYDFDESSVTADFVKSYEDMGVSLGVYIPESAWRRPVFYKRTIKVVRNGDRFSIRGNLPRGTELSLKYRGEDFSDEARFYRKDFRSYKPVESGIDGRNDYIWLETDRTGRYTIKDASKRDFDSDGLSDLVELSSPSDRTLTEKDFSSTKFETNSISKLVFDRNTHGNLFCSRAYIELKNMDGESIDGLEVDVGNDGKTDWEAVGDVKNEVSFGRLKLGINLYWFNHYVNEKPNEVTIPIRFESMENRDVKITDAEIEFEGVDTSPVKADTNGDGLLDGWKDVDGDMEFERKGEDGVLATSDDEIPGALVRGLNPTEVQYMGRKGRVDWNRYKKGVNQANGNLFLSKSDLSVDGLGFNMGIGRHYNSFNHDRKGPLGYGWTMNYFAKIVPSEGEFVTYFNGEGTEYRFESLGGGDYESPHGCGFDLIREEDAYKLRFPSGKVKIFDEKGRLARIEDRNENSLHFTYGENGNLKEVEDDSGLRIELYYEDGKLVKVKDPIGRTCQYEYKNDRLVKFIDAGGNEYRYTYGRDDLLNTIINPVGLFKYYDYSHSGLPKVERIVKGKYENGMYMNYHVDFEADYTYPSHTAWKDGEGNEITNSFGKGGVMIKHENPDGTVSYLGYDLDHDRVRVVDKKGYVWHNEFGPIGKLVKSKDSTGNVTKKDWKRVANSDEYICVKESSTDKRGYTRERNYDEDFDLKSTVKKDGARYRYVRNDKGQLTKLIKPNGAVTRYEYDEHGNRIKKINALGHETKYVYNEIGWKKKVIKPNGAVTKFEYNELGKRTKIIDDKGNVIKKEYDAVGNLVKKVNKRGGETRYKYDVFGNMISKTDPLGNTVEYRYDNNGNKVLKIGPRGYPTYYEYDCMDRLVEKTDAYGNSVEYRYDEFHNRIETIDKNGNSWKKKYDKMGRVTAKLCPYGKAIRYEYNSEGQVVKKIDRMGYVTEYEYDKVGRVVRMKRKLGPEGTNVTLRYDEVGNLVSVTQADGNDTSTWHYEYDLLGRKVKEISPLGNVENYDYDKMGNIVEYTNAEGESTQYDHDSLGRLTSVEFPDGKSVDITRNLDKNMKIQEYTYPDGSAESKAPNVKKVIEKYDLMGRTTKRTTVWGSGEERSISYEYDSAGNMIKMNDQFGRTTEYYYDALNRLDAVVDHDGDVTTYEYDAKGNLVETTLPTGTKVFRDYNKADKLTELKNVKSNGEVISSFEYGYNWNGNIVSVTNKHGNTTHYNYDKESRLTSVEYPSGSKMKYKYDKKDNLLEKKRIVDDKVVNTVNNEYDDENRLISSNEKTYSYDKDGNQIRAGDTSFDYTTSFVNGKNVKRLKSVSESDEHVSSYSYTLEGQRTGKYLHDGDSKITYHYSGRNVQYEQWSSGRTVRYTHPIEGGSSCSSCGGCGGNSGVFTDHPISIEVNGTKYYYLYNGQGSVTELINADEEVVNQYRYTPFGSPRLKIESVYNPYEYTGRRLDDETGQYYYRARMYSAEQCRFTTQDPAGMQEGPNMYAYVDNNPVNHRDPTGLLAGEDKIDGGGGGSSPCYELPAYDTMEECQQNWDYEYCVENCFGDDSGGSEPPAGANCDVTSSITGGLTLYCNEEAAGWIGLVAGSMSVAAMFSSLGISFPVSAASGVFGLAASACSQLGMGFIIQQTAMTYMCVP